MIKRKVMVGVLTAALSLGALGTVAFANELPTKQSINEMLPFMKKMHPNSSDQQLEYMYKSCHGNGGMMKNYDAIPQHKNMMNNL